MLLHFCRLLHEIMLINAQQFSWVWALTLLLACSNAQYTTTVFRASDIQITPELVILNATGTVNFTCSTYRTTDSPLEASLSKDIPSTEVRLSTSPVNKTALQIQLEAKNYIGAFHLLCYAKGERSRGNRADVIVIAAPGVLQLAEKCRVYDKQYIKCVIRAPNIARAVQNDYPAKFEFTEIAFSPDRMAYRPRVELLKNESTRENLTFLWRPTVDAEFPDGVRMHIKAILPHFGDSSYYFDMTPIFRITPKFDVRALSNHQIQMNVGSMASSAICEKSIASKLVSSSNAVWTLVEANKNKTTFSNLVPNTLFQVCMKCRQVYSDPDGTPECREVRTLGRLHWFLENKLFLLLIILFLAVLSALTVMFLFRKRRPSWYMLKHLLSFKPHDTPTDSELETPSARSSLMQNAMDDGMDSSETSGSSDGSNYQPMASMEDIMDQCASPRILA